LNQKKAALQIDEELAISAGHNTGTRKARLVKESSGLMGTFPKVSFLLWFLAMVVIFSRNNICNFKFLPEI